MPTPQDKLRRNPSIWTDYSILRSAPSETILVPELSFGIPSNIIKLADALSLSLNEPPEAPAKVSLSCALLSAVCTSPWKERHHLSNAAVRRRQRRSRRVRCHEGLQGECKTGTRSL